MYCLGMCVPTDDLKRVKQLIFYGVLNMYKKLNKDEIKLLRLLSDAYNFGNIADVDNETDKEFGGQFVGNYETMDLINGLDANLVSQICNPISKIITSILGQELHDYWVNGSNYDVDWLIRITDSQETSKLSREEFENLMVSVAQ